MLAGAVLVYLDEEKVDARKREKVKLYIDADRTSIRMMRTDSFMFANRTHWIAAYNFKDGVPVEDGDERIIMVHVPVLFNDEKDDWDEVMRDRPGRRKVGLPRQSLGNGTAAQRRPSLPSCAFNAIEGRGHGSRPRKREADLRYEAVVGGSRQDHARSQTIRRQHPRVAGSHWAKAVGPSSPIRYATTCKRSRIIC